MSVNEHWCWACPHADIEAEKAAAAERARSEQRRRRGQLQQFAAQHKAQRGRHGHDFKGYDRHLALSCAWCLAVAGFHSEIDPAEAAALEELSRT